MAEAGSGISLRDIVGEGTLNIRIDSHEQFAKLQEFGHEFMPSATARLALAALKMDFFRLRSLLSAAIESNAEPPPTVPASQTSPAPSVAPPRLTETHDAGLASLPWPAED